MFGKLQYAEYELNICGNLNVIVFILGLQLGYTKQTILFIQDWNSREREKLHYKRMGEMIIHYWTEYVKQDSLRDPKTVYLHTTLGLMKNFVKIMGINF